MQKGLPLLCRSFTKVSASSTWLESASVHLTLRHEQHSWSHCNNTIYLQAPCGPRWLCRDLSLYSFRISSSKAVKQILSLRRMGRGSYLPLNLEQVHHIAVCPKSCAGSSRHPYSGLNTVASISLLTCHQDGGPEAVQVQRQPMHESAGQCPAGSHQSAANCCPAPADASAGRPHSLTLQHVIALTDLHCAFRTRKLITWHGCDAGKHVGCSSLHVLLV